MRINQFTVHMINYRVFFKQLLVPLINNDLNLSRGGAVW